MDRRHDQIGVGGCFVEEAGLVGQRGYALLWVWGVVFTWWMFLDRNRTGLGKDDVLLAFTRTNCSVDFEKAATAQTQRGLISNKQKTSN